MTAAQWAALAVVVALVVGALLAIKHMRDKLDDPDWWDE